MNFDWSSIKWQKLGIIWCGYMRRSQCKRFHDSSPHSYKTCRLQNGQIDRQTDGWMPLVSWAKNKMVIQIRNNWKGTCMAMTQALKRHFLIALVLWIGSKKCSFLKFPPNTHSPWTVTCNEGQLQCTLHSEASPQTFLRWHWLFLKKQKQYEDTDLNINMHISSALRKKNMFWLSEGTIAETHHQVGKY
jgi:hypothetical protein